MEFSIEIDLDNSAFDGKTDELARILRDLADGFDGHETKTAYGLARDYNGNVCGAWKIEESN